MIIGGYELIKIDDYIWEIPKSGAMKVPGRIFADIVSQKKFVSEDCVKQVANVACLPGIQKYSLAMPDIHWGYGFPIGGVAALEIESGAISPGGVGYDINCGVRLASTPLVKNSIVNKLEELTNLLFNSIPTGVGSKGAIDKISMKELKEILLNGASWAAERGFGTSDDIEKTEEKGTMKEADIEPISKNALERGLDQVGTLGSGNHFLEIGFVERIFNHEAAKNFGLFKDQITVLIHSGSRGLGYQICDDHLKTTLHASQKYGYELPDKQLACVPFNSTEGQNYFRAMKAAANYAWCNRQVIMDLARKSFAKATGISSDDFNLVYDLSHNIAKLETHIVDGVEKQLCVHRKGATRAFPKGSLEIPEKYRNIGQPVLVPGDMGRSSYILIGEMDSLEKTFGSSCHGAGRVLSRHQAIKTAKGRNIIEEMKRENIIVKAKSKSTLAEEASFAYKDVSDVVETMHRTGVSSKVAKLKPLAVIKG